MRLWHSKLIPFLDGRRLCDLHMSCCNLRGNGWGKRNAAVGYLYEDEFGEDALYEYHLKVLEEMEWRGYEPAEDWFDPHYCGKKRPGRSIDYSRLEEVSRRNIPLKGHTEELFEKDFDTLQDRGLNIDQLHTMKVGADGHTYSVHIITNGSIERKYIVVY